MLTIFASKKDLWDIATFELVQAMQERDEKTKIINPESKAQVKRRRS